MQSDPLKRHFLEKLQGPKGYKRYRGMPLRYGGGKSLAVGHIVERLPAGLRRLMSPFIGGGSVEIACARELDMEVRGFDVFDLLANYWDVQINRADELADLLDSWAPLTRESFWASRAIAKDHFDGKRLIADPLERAARYWYCHNMSYGPGFPGWLSKNYLKRQTYDRAVQRVRDFDGRGLAVACGDFHATIPAHPDWFMYVDPPYYLKGDSKTFAGMYPHRTYPQHHNGFDHEGLRDLLHAHKAGFVLSYGDCSTIRDWYADYEIVEVSWQITIGQGELRIGANRQKAAAGHVKQSHEILIVKPPENTD